MLGMKLSSCHSKAHASLMALCLYMLRTEHTSYFQQHTEMHLAFFMLFTAQEFCFFPEERNDNWTGHSLTQPHTVLLEGYSLPQQHAHLLFWAFFFKPLGICKEEKLPHGEISAAYF